MNNIHICPLCKESKPLTEFAPKAIQKSGINGSCRECKTAYQQAYAARAKRGLTRLRGPASDKFSLPMAIMNYKTADRFWELVGHKYADYCRNGKGDRPVGRKKTARNCLRCGKALMTPDTRVCHTCRDINKQYPEGTIASQVIHDCAL